MEDDDDAGNVALLITNRRGGQLDRTALVAGIAEQQSAAAHVDPLAQRQAFLDGVAERLVVDLIDECHELAERHANRVATAHVQRLLGGTIDRRDDALPVRRDHALGDRLERLVAGGQGTAGARTVQLALVNVARDRQHRRLAVELRQRARRFDPVRALVGADQLQLLLGRHRLAGQPPQRGFAH